MAKGFKVPHLPYCVTPTDEIDLKQKSAKILLQLYKKQQRSSVSFKDEVKKLLTSLTMILTSKYY